MGSDCQRNLSGKEIQMLAISGLWAGTTEPVSSGSFNGKPCSFYFTIIIWAYNNFPRSHWSDKNNKNKRRSKALKYHCCKGRTTSSRQKPRELPGRSEPGVTGYLTTTAKARLPVWVRPGMLGCTALCQPGLEAKILWDLWKEAHGGLGGCCQHWEELSILFNTGFHT